MLIVKYFVNTASIDRQKKQTRAVIIQPRDEQYSARNP